MNNTLLVALREFRVRVRQRGFLLTSIITPVIMLVIWAATGSLSGNAPQAPAAALTQGAPPTRTIGYVDQAQLIQTVPPPIPVDLFRAYADAEAASTALRAGQIGAYYVIPPDYRETGNIRRVSLRLDIAPTDESWVNWLLVRNLFPGLSVEQVSRLRFPFNATAPNFVFLTSSAETGTPGNPLLPFVVAIAVIAPLLTSGSFLFQSLAKEKSSRVMEILLVSLRPRQLLTGKLLGLGALTLVQYVIWALMIVAALVANRTHLSTFLSEINLSGYEVFLVVLFALGGFTIYAAIMAGIGALAPDLESSRSWLIIINLPMLVPIYLQAAIVSAPNGGLAVALSLIPFSAPVAMLMRMISTVVPGWQIALSLAIVFLAGMGMVWLMARLFRAQTLLSGESLSLGRLAAALRG